MALFAFISFFIYFVLLLRKREEAKKKTFISFNFGGQVVSVVTGSEIEKKKEEEGETEPKKKTYDSDSDSDVDIGDETNVVEEMKAAAESKGDGNDENNNGGDVDDDFVDDELEAEFIENEEFCPMKPKDVPFGVAANLSITAPVYHTSASAKSEDTQKDNDDDPFSSMNDKGHRSRVQHDYFAD